MHYDSSFSIAGEWRLRRPRFSAKGGQREFDERTEELKKEVLIDIKGVYQQDGESDEIELFTTGTYYKRDGCYCIAYEESEMTGFEGTHTTVRVREDGSMVTLARTGASKSQLIVEQGVRHQCHYDTGYGAMTIGVSGDRIVSTLDKTGGRLEFGYSLDINTSLASENQITIQVRQSGAQ